MDEITAVKKEIEVVTIRITADCKPDPYDAPIPAGGVVVFVCDHANPKISVRNSRNPFEENGTHKLVNNHLSRRVKPENDHDGDPCYEYTIEDCDHKGKGPFVDPKMRVVPGK